MKLDNDELKDYDLWCVRTSPDSGQRGRRTVMKLLFLFGLVLGVCVSVDENSSNTFIC